MKTVLLYRESILPKSETFIVDQAAALRAYRPVISGLYRAEPSAELPCESVVLTERRGMLMRPHLLGFRYLRFAPGFRGRLRRLQPAVLHAHFATDAVSALPLADALDVPLVVTLHGYDATTSDAHFARSPRGRYYLRLRKALFARASRFLCVSDYIRQCALRAGYPAEKLTVQYTGVDRARFRPATGSARDRRRVLFVGRLVEKKGCADVVAAMEYVQREVPEAILEVIGDGPLRPTLEQYAQQKNLPVRFRGAQDHKEVCRSMATAAVLCNPSVTAENGDSEGFGMVFAEAQAMGTPVVSTRHGGIPEAVSDGATAILCEERAPRQLADAIIRFLHEPSLWQRASEQSVAWVADRFDIAAQTERLEQIYEES